jgi:DNA-binding MarR family transcriptional regulator
LSLVSEKDIPKATANLELTKRKGTQRGNEYNLIRKNGGEFLAEVSSSVIKKGSEEIVGIVTIYNDITERKRTERAMRKKIMKYDLEEGNLYLVQEASSNMSREAFKDLLKVGYPGLMMTRTPEEKIAGWKDHDFTHIWLAEKGRNAISPDLEVIEKWFEEQEKGQAFLLERLDYLISKNGFKKTLAFVQTLNEIAHLRNHIIILSVDPTVVRKNDIRQLEKETVDVEAIYQGKLPHDVLSLLRIVHEQNVMGLKPTYSFLGEELRISKPTTRKRVRKLIGAGYLHESVDGRSKILELTEKGRSVFDRAPHFP